MRIGGKTERLEYRNRNNKKRRRIEGSRQDNLNGK